MKLRGATDWERQRRPQGRHANKAKPGLKTNIRDKQLYSLVLFKYTILVLSQKALALTTYIDKLNLDGS